MLPPLSKVIAFLSVTFYIMIKYFWSVSYKVATTILFLWIQAVVVQSQITCKRVNFIKT